MSCQNPTRLLLRSCVAAAGFAGLAAARGADAVLDRLLDRYRQEKESITERSSIVRELGALRDAGAEKAVADILAADPSEAVRIAAVEALAARGTDAAARAALDAARASDPWVTEAVVRALARSTPEPTAEWMRASGLKKDARPELRAAVATLLGSLARPDALKVLRPLARDPEWQVREATAPAIARLDPGAAIAAVEALALDRHPRVRIAALSALEVVPGEKAERLLRDAVEKDAVWQARVAAARALARRDAARHRALLFQVLRDPKADWHVRVACLAGVERLRSKATIDDLVSTLRDEPGRPEVDVRRALHALTGRTLASRADWKAWWEAERAAFAVPEAVAPGPPSAGRTRARFFGLPVDSSRVCFLVDASGSMSLEADSSAARGAAPRTRLDAARAELRRAIEALPAGAAAGVVLFRDRTIPIQETPAPAGPALAARVLKEVEPIEGEGETDLYGALGALLHGSGPDDPLAASLVPFDTVCVISDGLPSAGAVTDPTELLRRFRLWNRFAMVRVLAVETGAGAGASVLAGLARETGGLYGRT